MTLSILLFRYIAFSVVAVIFIELMIHVTFSEYYDKYPPNFFEYAPLKYTNRAKLIVAEKLIQVNDKKPDIIQVGGSSGLHGINPVFFQGRIDGYSYYNLSCCRNTGYTGYRYLAQIAIEKNPEVKAVLLYLSPFSMPTKYGPFTDTKLSESIYNEYISIKKFSNNIPSNRVRRYVTNMLFYRNNDTRIHLDKTMTLDGLDDYDNLVSALTESNGWLPFNNRSKLQGQSDDYMKSMHDGNAYNDFEKELTKMLEVLEPKGVKLILAFAPVPFANPRYMLKSLTDRFDSRLNSFAMKNSNVFLATHFYTEFNDTTLFGDNIHLTPKGSIKATRRLEKSLREITELL